MVAQKAVCHTLSKDFLVHRLMSGKSLNTNQYNRLSNVYSRDKMWVGVPVESYKWQI